MRIRVEAQVGDIKEVKDDALTQWAGEVSAKLVMMPSEHEELRVKMKVLQETLKTIVTEKKNYQVNQQNYKKQIVQLRSQIAIASQGEIEDLSNKIETLEAMLADLKTPTIAFSELNTQLMALQQEHSALKTSSELLIKSNAKLRTQLNGVIEDSERQAQQYETWQQELTRRVAEQEEIQKANVSDLQIQLSQTKTALSKRWAELEKRVNSLEVWRDQLQKQIADLKPGNEELREKLALMHASLQKVLDDQMKQQFQQASCQKQIAQLRHQIEAVEDAKNIAPLEDKIKNLEGELALLKTHPNGTEVTAHLNSLQNEFMLIKKSAEQVAKVNSSLRSQLQGVIEESTIQSQRIADWQKEFSQQLKQATEQQDAALSELQAQLSQSKAAISKRLAALEGRVVSLEEKQADLEVKHQVLATKTDPDITTAKKLQLLRQAVLSNKQIEAELAYYIAPNGQAELSSSDASPLQAWIENEFLQGEKRVLLLHGGAGAGKTTFNRYLERQLWQSKEWDSLIPGKTVPKCMVPIFIPLGSSRGTLFDYLKNARLSLEGFTDAEINVLKRDYQILLIADGYDEIPSKKPVNLYDENKLQQYEGRVKLLIGCRTQRVLELSEEEWFAPHLEDKSSQHYYHHRMISPFNDKQIADYIERYLQNKKFEKDKGISLDILLWSDAITYQRQIEKLPDLRVLIDTPFLLLITMEVLPKIVAEVEKEGKDTKETKSSLGAVDLTKMKLYDEFIAQWFKRQKDKAIEAGALPAKKDIMSYYQEFCLKFAECLLKMGGTTVQYPYEENSLFPEAKDSWVADLFDDKNFNVSIARKGSPLTTTVDNYHGFIHASLIDYFSMRRIVQDYKSKLIQQKEPISSKVTPILEKKETTPTTPKPEVEVILPTVSASSAEALLNFGKLTYDQIQFLVDHSQQDIHFKDYLFSLIQRSKKESGLATAAANAITVLNLARVVFSGMDFSGICVPGADLSNAILDHTQLQGADLSNAILQGAWMRNANLSQAKLSGVRFNEEPYLQFHDDIKAYALSPDMLWLAVACSEKSWLPNGFPDIKSLYDMLYLYNFASRQRIQIINSDQQQNFKKIIFSPDGQQVIFFSTKPKIGYIIQSRQISTGEMKVIKPSIPEISNILFDSDIFFDANGELLANSKKAGLWSLSSGKQLDNSLFKVDVGTMQKMILSPDRQYLATLNYSSSNHCYDKIIYLSTWTKISASTRLAGHTDSVSAFVFSPNSKYLASISTDMTIRVWSIASKSTIHVFEADTLFERVIFNSAGDEIAAVSKDTIYLWSVISGELQQIFQGIGNIKDLIFSPDDKQLISSTEGGIIQFWPLVSRKFMPSVREKTGKVRKVIFNPSWKYVVSLGKSICYRSAESGKVERIIKIDADQMSPDSKYVASIKPNGDLHLISLYPESASHLLEHSKTFRNYQIVKVVFSCDNRYVATGNSDKSITVWEVKTGKWINTLEGHAQRVNGIAFSPSGKYIASVNNRKLRMWEVRDWHRVCEVDVKNVVNNLVFSLDEKYLAFDDGHIWSLNSAKARHTISLEKPGDQAKLDAMAFSPDGKYFAASIGSVIHIWTVSNGKSVIEIKGLIGGVHSIAWNQTDSALLLITGNGDKTVGCWQLYENEKDVKVILRWINTQSSLNLAGADITGATELDADYQILLKQRGAIGIPAEVKSDKTASPFKKDPTDIKGLAAPATRFGLLASSPSQGSAGASTNTLAIDVQNFSASS